MQIKTFNLSAMPNVMYAGFHNTTYDNMVAANPQNLGIAVPVAQYGAMFDKLKITLDVASASPMQPEILARDRKRDRGYSSLKSYFKTMANDPDEAKSVLAEKLLYYVRTTETEQGNPLTMGLANGTVVIESLLRRLEPFAADMEAIGATARYNALSEANSAVEAIMQQRLDEKGSKQSGNVKPVRAELDGAYKMVITCINALVAMQGEDKFAAIIAKQNALIDEYTAKIAAHRTSVKSSKATATDENAQQA